MRSKKITSSAKGENCTLNIAGICNYDPATTVFCHFPDESHGMSKKADDISGGYGCSACHDAIDARGSKCMEFWVNADFYLRRSQVRTIRKLIEKGILCIK